MAIYVPNIAKLIAVTRLYKFCRTERCTRCVCAINLSVRNYFQSFFFLAFCLNSQFHGLIFQLSIATILFALCTVLSLYYGAIICRSSRENFTVISVIANCTTTTQTRTFLHRHSVYLIFSRLRYLLALGQAEFISREYLFWSVPRITFRQTDF